jgi:hypothetical protein
MNRGDLRTDIIQQQNISILEAALAALAAGLGFKVVSVPITGALIGANTIPVLFPVALSARPRFVQRPTFEKTDPMDDNIDALTVDSITQYGFNVNLSAGAISGHILHCSYLP